LGVFWWNLWSGMVWSGDRFSEFLKPWGPIIFTKILELSGLRHGPVPSSLHNLNAEKEKCN
jgi:hypothetical protein